MARNKIGKKKKKSQNLSSQPTRNEDEDSFHTPKKRPTLRKFTTSKASTPATASTLSSLSPLSLTSTKSSTSSSTDKRLRSKLFQVNLSDDEKGRNKKQKKDKSPNDGATSNQPTATSVQWTSQEGINRALACFFEPEEYRSMSLEERAKLLSTVFTPSDMKVVFTSMWMQAGNDLDKVNLNSLKPRKKLDEAISQLCVTLTERRHAKNTCIPNDVSVVK